MITRKQSITLEGYVAILAKCLHTFCESATLFLMNNFESIRIMKGDSLGLLLKESPIFQCADLAFMNNSYYP
jgi:hypothetical protein